MIPGSESTSAGAHLSYAKRNSASKQVVSDDFSTIRNISNKSAAEMRARKHNHNYQCYIITETLDKTPSCCYTARYTSWSEFL